jgi:cell filamentation protein
MRVLQLREDPSQLPTSYDLAHLCAIHHYLFQDIYDWAGQVRRVGLEKGGEDFAPPLNIAQASEHAAFRAHEVGLLRGLSRADAVLEVAYLYDYWNFAHPFREGNGRAQREFFDQLLAESGRGLAWDNVESQTLHEACHMAREHGDLDGLVAMFDVILDDDPAYAPRVL